MDTPRHDDIDNPPDYCTLRYSYRELWDRLKEVEALGLFTQDHKPCKNHSYCMAGDDGAKFCPNCGEEEQER